MAITVKHNGEDKYRDWTECCSIVHSTPVTQVIIKLEQAAQLYGPEVTKRWLKIIALIDKNIIWKEENNAFTIELYSKNYANNVDLYTTFIMVRWLWRFRGLIPQVFKIREETKLIWFKCIQAAHLFKVNEDNKDEQGKPILVGGYHNFFDGFKDGGYRRELLTYKEFLALPKTAGYINKTWNKFFVWDGTIADLTNDVNIEDTIEISQANYDKIESIIHNFTDKNVYILLQPWDANVALNSIWLKPNNVGTSNLKRMIENNSSMRSYDYQTAVKDEKGNAAGHGVPDNRCAIIDFSKIKVKKQ